jgi:hypothetical protein
MCATDGAGRRSARPSITATSSGAFGAGRHQTAVWAPGPRGGRRGRRPAALRGAQRSAGRRRSRRPSARRRPRSWAEAPSSATARSHVPGQTAQPAVAGRPVDALSVAWRDGGEQVVDRRPECGVGVEPLGTVGRARDRAYGAQRAQHLKDGRATDEVAPRRSTTSLPFLACPRARTSSPRTSAHRRAGRPRLTLDGGYRGCRAARG